MLKISHLANAITTSRFILGFPVLWLLTNGRNVAALSVYIIGALSDALDGWAARKFSQPSKQGRLIDAIADRLFILLTMTGLFLSGMVNSEVKTIFFVWIGGEMIIGMAMTKITGELYLFAEHRHSIRITAFCTYITIGLIMIQSVWLPILLATTLVLMVATTLDYSIWLFRQRNAFPSEKQNVET